MLQEMKSNNLSCQSGQPKGNRGLVKPLDILQANSKTNDSIKVSIHAFSIAHNA